MNNAIIRISAQAEITGVPGDPWRRKPPRGVGLEGEKFSTQVKPHQSFLGQTQFGQARFGQAEEIAIQDLIAEEAARRSAAEQQEAAEEQRELERQRRIYRSKTVSMLRRYLRYSVETGRIPSVLGAEFFRAKASANTLRSFEDRVIFVHDMETCLERLDEFSQQLIARNVLQEHDQAATGRLLNCHEKTVRLTVPVVLDRLAEILLEVGLMRRLDFFAKNSCQGGKND
jgi:hypothetical protein